MTEAETAAVGNATPPHGLDEFEGVVVHTVLPMLTAPTSFLRELVAYVRALEGVSKKSAKSPAGFDRGDTVIVSARPHPYRATVGWVDRALNGRALTVQVRPHPGQNVSERVRNVSAKSILDTISRG